MENLIKPVFNEEDIWCTIPGGGDLVKPDISKIAKGFRYGEIPKHSTFNWTGNFISNYCVHSNKTGVPSWDTETTYTKGSLVSVDDGSTRQLYIANNTTTGEDPLSSPSWRQFYENLSDFDDVELANLQTGDVLQQFIYDDRDTYPKVWENVPSSSIMSLRDIQDVIGAPSPGKVLYQMDLAGVDNQFYMMEINHLLHYMYLKDFYDVSPSNEIKNDVLTYDTGFWMNKPFNGFIEWEDVILKHLYYNPPQSTVDQVGGMLLDFQMVQNEPVLRITSTSKSVPSRPKNLNATNHLSDKITLTWETPDNEAGLTKYIIHRNNQYLDEVLSGTLTYDDTSPDLNKLYSYKVYAVNTNGTSLPSNTATGAIVDTLSAPGNFKASDNISTNQIICSWDDVPGAIGYNIYKVGTPDVYVAGGVKSPYVYNTTPNVTADFYVKAVNLNGDEGNASITDTGKTASISGSRVFKTTGQFTVPNGITELEICVTGGGGSGSIGTWDGYPSGGGYAGQFIRQKMSVTEGDLLQVTIGFGGKPSDYTVVSDGVSGDNSVIENLVTHELVTAKGGKGGSARSASYRGNGASLTSECTGVKYYDGLQSNRPWGVSCYGGQASQYGNGGSRNGKRSGSGAGGSAISKYRRDYDNQIFCDGGNGICVISWGDVISTESTESTSNTETYNIHTTGIPEIIEGEK
jgi:hypothetical protein